MIPDIGNSTVIYLAAPRTSMNSFQQTFTDEICQFSQALSFSKGVALITLTHNQLKHVILMWLSNHQPQL